MAKVYGLHQLELKAGVDALAFETYFTHELGPVLRHLPGQTTYFTKGDRGARDGRYLLIIEIETVERRDALYPIAGGGGEEFDRLFADNRATMEKLFTFVEAFPDPQFTDYVVVE